MLTIASFLFVIGLLILVHELGHFVSAKAVGVKVEEFGLGYPPRLFAIRAGETEYSLNLLLPLGGFVRLAGQEDPSQPRGLAGKSIWARLLVLSSGSVMNALLPIVLFSVSFMVPKDVLMGQVQVQEVSAGSPAEKAGIHGGDIVLKIDNRPIRSIRDLSYNIQLHIGSEMTMVLKTGRYSQEVVRLIPRWNPPSGEGPVGIAVGLANPYVVSQSYPFFDAVRLGLRTSVDTLSLGKNEVIGYIVRRMAPAVSGPIGIAQATGEVARVGFGALMEFAALLSMNLAVVNMLPVPMLDGGRLFFVVLEWVRRGKRISPKREGLVHLVGLVLLMGFVILISYYDILRIIRGESILR